MIIGVSGMQLFLVCASATIIVCNYSLITQELLTNTRNLGRPKGSFTPLETPHPIGDDDCKKKGLKVKGLNCKSLFFTRAALHYFSLSFSPLLSFSIF